MTYQKQPKSFTVPKRRNKAKIYGQRTISTLAPKQPKTQRDKDLQARYDKLKETS